MSTQTIDDDRQLSTQVEQDSPGTMSIATTRQAQEVQAAMIVAKRFPRDETLSLSRILRACKRKGLAEHAAYSYPRGGTRVVGPSIRLAEAMAQAWGNIDYGVIELEQRQGESVCMAYAWDLETNTRRQMIFNVPHKRHTKEGSYMLTDPRDIYEMVANQGARRVRACILGIIPGDVQDDAVQQCNRTLAESGGSVPLKDRIRKMIIAFEEFGVTKDMLEQKVGFKSEAWSEHDFVSLKNVYTSLRDQVGKREDFFSAGKSAPAEQDNKPASSRAASVANRVKPKEQTQAEPEAPADEPTEDQLRAEEQAMYEADEHTLDDPSNYMPE
ncbi:hypothetical protein GYB59_18995 [bacterium]|nr:hypothetical protein [bacterium]